MKKSIIVLCLSLMLSGVMCFNANADFSRTRSYTPGQFTDVPADAWYAGTVKDCYELGLINGSSDTTYNPQGFFTLAQAATIASRMHEIHNGGDGVIPAASGEWYQGAVDYCIANGIIAKDEYRDYTKNATRAEMSKIMYNALPKSEWKAINKVQALPDVDKNNTKNGSIIFALYEAGIFTGSDEYGKFQPGAAITRAEVSALVARMADSTQRKTLSLRPLAEKQGIRLPENSYAYTNEIRDGYFSFENADTKLWGIMDVSGNLVAPAIYEYASYNDGYFMFTENGTDEKGNRVMYSYVTDVAGNTVIPRTMGDIEYKGNGFFRLEYGFYHLGTFIGNHYTTTTYKLYANHEALNEAGFFVLEDPKDDYTFSVADINGKTIVPFGEYQSIEYNGKDAIVVAQSLNYNYYMSRKLVTVYDTNGNILWQPDKEKNVICNSISGTLYAVRDNGTNKWGVASNRGMIADCLFDNVSIITDGNTTVAKAVYGNDFALYTEAGVLFDFGSGYESVSVIDGKILMRSKDSIHLYDAAKTLILDLGAGFKSLGHTGEFAVDDYLFSMHDNKYIWLNLGVFYCYDKATGKFVKGEEKYYYYTIGDEKYLTDWTKVVDVKEIRLGAAYLAENGKYGYSDDYSVSNSPAIYNTVEDVEKYGCFYRDDYMYAMKTIDGYYVLKDEASGKPYIGYGNEIDGYTPVVTYYQKPFYYDSINYIDFGNYNV